MPSPRSGGVEAGPCHSPNMWSHWCRLTALIGGCALLACSFDTKPIPPGRLAPNVLGAGRSGSSAAGDGAANAGNSGEAAANAGRAGSDEGAGSGGSAGRSVAGTGGALAGSGGTRWRGRARR